MPASAGGRCDGRGGWGSRDKFDGCQQGGRVSAGCDQALPRRPRRRSTVPRPRARRGGPTRRPGATSTTRPRPIRASEPSGRAASSAPARGAGATCARPLPSSSRAPTAPTAAAGRRSPRAWAVHGLAPGRPTDASPIPSARPARRCAIATRPAQAARLSAGAETG